MFQQNPGNTLIYYVNATQPNCNVMKSRFKTTNLIGWLIALILIASGFVLATIHKRSEPAKASKQTTANLTKRAGAAFSEVTPIHDEPGDPAPAGGFGPKQLGG